MEYITLIGILLLAALASTIVGAVWYSPFLFGKLWMKLSGISYNFSDSEKKRKMITGTLGSFLGEIFVAAALLLVPLITGASPFILSFIYWIGFMVPVMKDGPLYENRSWKVFFIQAGYRIVSLLVMSLVFYFI